MIFSFCYFAQERGSDIHAKMSPEETICMKCQNLFSGKNKIFQNCCMLKFVPSMLSVNSIEPEDGKKCIFWHVRQAKLRSACASPQPDQSRRCTPEGTLDPAHAYSSEFSLCAYAIQYNIFTNSRIQLHEFTNSTSRIQLQEFNSWIREVEFVNSWSWIREFVKLNSWSGIREVEFVNSWSWIREFVKLNSRSGIREVEFVNSWSWNREFVKLKSWIRKAEIVNSWSWNLELM